MDEKAFKELVDDINDTEELWFDVPLVESQSEQDYLCNKLVSLGAIPKKDLVVGQKYKGSARNSSFGVWDGKMFTIMRSKFGILYEQKIQHYEDSWDDDIFIPLEKCDE